MRVLIEAHHPGDIHFWKYPIQELLERKHDVLMIARDRDVMRHLVETYDWIPAIIPPRRNKSNRFPVVELLGRQWRVAREVRKFRPDVVASLFGSYCQSARLLGCRNIIFTDSEFQHFNHRIAHPFAHAIHTPYCFYKKLGRKQVFYRGIHEMAFLGPARFIPDASILGGDGGLRRHDYIVIRLSAWNTFHDINHSGVGEQVGRFIDQAAKYHRIVICAEENALPASLRRFAMRQPPSKFHDVLAHARFVLTEGASTASEAACLGIPTVYINSTEPRGYLKMLEEDWGLVRCFGEAEPGLLCAQQWLPRINEAVLGQFQETREALFSAHDDVVEYVTSVLENSVEA